MAMSDRIWRTLWVPVEAWPAALRAMPEGDARTVLADLLDAWVEGEVYAILDPGAPSPRSLDRRLAAVFATALDLQLDTRIRGASDESSVRRWCWIEYWILSEQDEDIFLMDEPCLPWLLDEAGAGCAKRDYALSIVGHSVRDAAHASLKRDFRNHVRRAVGLLPLARAADAPDLVAYLERLARYAQPGKVDENEARSRVSDLTRCAAPAQVSVARHRDRWTGPFGLTIDGHTGEMWIDRK
jgi:hypothetical protein